MNNARKTLNVLLNGVVTARLVGFVFYTGDEDNPEMTFPAVGIHWLDGSQPGRLSESRKRLVQLEVLTSSSDTSSAELACEVLLDALSLRTGSQPKGLVPKVDYNAGPPGIPYTYPMPPLMVTPQGGWQRIPSPQASMRMYVLTLEVDYVPDRTLPL